MGASVPTPTTPTTSADPNSIFNMINTQSYVSPTPEPLAGVGKGGTAAPAPTQTTSADPNSIFNMLNTQSYVSPTPEPLPGKGGTTYMPQTGLYDSYGSGSIQPIAGYDDQPSSYVPQMLGAPLAQPPIPFTPQMLGPPIAQSAPVLQTMGSPAQGSPPFMPPVAPPPLSYMGGPAARTTPPPNGMTPWQNQQRMQQMRQRMAQNPMVRPEVNPYARTLPQPYPAMAQGGYVPPNANPSMTPWMHQQQMGQRPMPQQMPPQSAPRPMPQQMPPAAAGGKGGALPPGVNLSGRFRLGGRT